MSAKVEQRHRDAAQAALDVVASRVAERGWMDKPETTHAHTAAFLRSGACDSILAQLAADAEAAGVERGMEKAAQVCDERFDSEGESAVCAAAIRAAMREGKP